MLTTATAYFLCGELTGSDGRVGVSRSFRNKGLEINKRFKEACLNWNKPGQIDYVRVWESAFYL